MRRSLTYIVFIAVGFFTMVPQVHAQLLNGQVIRTIYFRGVQPDQTVIIADEETVVGPGVELPSVAGFLQIDFSDTNILITATQNAPLSNFELARFNTIVPAITSVTINPATNYAGFDASRIHTALGGHIIDVNLTGLNGLQGQQISLDVAGVIAPFSLTLSPPSGTYVTTQAFDLVLILQASGVTAVSGVATLDGVDRTTELTQCVVSGTLTAGGQTFRCPALSGAVFGPGPHTGSVCLNLSNGSQVCDTAAWDVQANTEP